METSTCMNFLKNINYNVLMEDDGNMLIELDFTTQSSEIKSASASVQSKLKWNVEFKAYGKICKMRRGICDYRTNIELDPSPLVFSKVPFFPEAMTPELLEVKNKVFSLLGIDFNACLVNGYGKDDEICAHSDDEDTVLKSFGVMSINAGPGSRIFRIKHKKSGKTSDFLSRPSYGLLMYGNNFQCDYTHSVLKNKIPKSMWSNGYVDELAGETRTSLTFRMHDEVKANANEKKREARNEKSDNKKRKKDQVDT